MQPYNLLLYLNAAFVVSLHQTNYISSVSTLVLRLPEYVLNSCDLSPGLLRATSWFTQPHGRIQRFEGRTIQLLSVEQLLRYCFLFLESSEFYQTSASGLKGDHRVLYA